MIKQRNRPTNWFYYTHLRRSRQNPVAIIVKDFICVCFFQYPIVFQKIKQLFQEGYGCTPKIFLFDGLFMIFLIHGRTIKFYCASRSAA